MSSSYGSNHAAASDARSCNAINQSVEQEVGVRAYRPPRVTVPGDQSSQDSNSYLKDFEESKGGVPAKRTVSDTIKKELSDDMGKSAPETVKVLEKEREISLWPSKLGLPSSSTKASGKQGEISSQKKKLRRVEMIDLHCSDDEDLVLDFPPSYFDRLLNHVETQISFLSSILDYNARKGVFPALYPHLMQDFIKESIQEYVLPEQLMKVLAMLRDKYDRVTKNGDFLSLNDRDKELFFLCKKIWKIDSQESEDEKYLSDFEETDDEVSIMNLLRGETPASLEMNRPVPLPPPEPPAKDLTQHEEEKKDEQESLPADDVCSESSVNKESGKKDEQESLPTNDVCSESSVNKENGKKDEHESLPTDDDCSESSVNKENGKKDEQKSLPTDDVCSESSVKKENGGVAGIEIPSSSRASGEDRDTE